jgi:hypothetical protein
MLLTKEELLQKGISEEDADEIMAKASAEPTQEDNLQALQKALDEDSPDATMDNLEKAEDEGEKEEDEEEKDEYNEKYMKKYMKRYMKENTKACQKMMSKMSKAIEEIDEESPGAVVEMADLAPFLDTVGEVIETMSKAIVETNERMDAIELQNEKSYDLLKKAATVQIEQAQGLKGFLSTSQGRKGVVTTAEMSKSTQPAKVYSLDDNRTVYQKLAKAMKEGKPNAGELLSVFESRNKNFNALNPAQKQAIQRFMEEAN